MLPVQAHYAIFPVPRWHHNDGFPVNHERSIMPSISEDTEYSDLTVQGIVFSAPEPFAEGHVLTGNEASVLNQTFQENLRNNFASEVKEEQEAATKESRPVDTAKLQAAFKTYSLEYEFGVRRGSSRTLDPVASAARDIAREAVRNGLRKKGVKLSDYTSAEINKMADDAVVKHAWIMQAAKVRVEAEKQIMGEVDLGNV